jgi:hypothetical protein
MKKFREHSRVWFILPWGILKGEVIDTTLTTYKVQVTKTGGHKKQTKIYNVENSKVYAWDDFKRACNMFEGLYL